MSDTVQLACGPARVTINRRGGELTAWSIDGHDLLWQSDPAAWARTSPILFPIVGWARDGQIRIDGEPRSMGVHGFAADCMFELVRQDETSAILALQDDAETRKQYPFAFRLEVHYRLGPQDLVVELRLLNRGRRDLPYAIGFHPGFAWPLIGAVRGGHTIEFAEVEHPHVPIITISGMFRGRHAQCRSTASNSHSAMNSSRRKPCASCARAAVHCATLRRTVHRSPSRSTIPPHRVVEPAPFAIRLHRSVDRPRRSRWLCR